MRSGAALLLCLATLAAPAADHVWLSAGRGTDGHVGPVHEGELYRFAFGRDWSEEPLWHWSNGWHVTPFWSVTIARALAERHPAPRDELWDLGIDTNARLSGPLHGRWQVFADVGFGINWVSAEHFDGLDLDTPIQFSPNVAIGIHNQRWEIGYQLWHLSNGNTGNINPGLNFHLLRIGYRFADD